MDVYNVLGELVVTLEDTAKPAGEYEITFDAPGLASGIYFYTLRAGGFSQSRSMVLLK